MKKIIALALVFMMVVPMMAFGVSADTITPDKSWYDASKTEFTITTVEQLYGFASLSVSNNFSGKTVKLGADIVVNEGEAGSWGTTPPAIAWTPIKSFAGTFDGQGHTISGLYAYGDAGQAFFAGCTATALVQNFNLVNSYFATKDGKTSAAGVCAGGGGTFRNIYCNADVVCGDHHAGGIFGCSGSKTVVENCWFDGTVNIKVRYAAGIVGNGNGQTVEIRHCLNTGTITTAHEGGNAHIAGMCGRNDAWTVIEDCLNLGKISSPLTEAGEDDQLGSIFGQCSANNQTEDKTAWKSHTTVKNCWASLESAIKTNAALSSRDPSQVHDFNAITEKLLKGYGGYLNTTLDFENYWCVDLNGYPRLQVFTAEEDIPALYDVNQPTVAEPELKLEGHFGPRWTVTLKVPEGFKKEEIKLGALIVPTAAIPAGHDVNLADTSFTYKGKEYEVANVEAKILRESADDEIVATFVVTDLAASNIRLDFTCVPYAIYTVDGGAELEMFGVSESMAFYQEAVLSYDAADEATKAAIDAVLAASEKVFGGRFPVLREWIGREEFADVPAMIVDGANVTEATDYGDGAWVITVDGTMDDDYYAYLEVLKNFGFEQVYANNGIDGEGIEDVVYNTTFQKGDLTVTVVDMCYINKTYITAKFNQKLSPHLYDNFSDDVIEGAVNKMHVNELVYWGNSIVFQLKNGHFILNDGATDEELPYLLDYLETLVPEGEIPVIEAWFISHMHYDHDCVFRPMTKNPEWVDRVRVDGVYVSEPSNAVKDLDPGVYNEITGVKAALNIMKTEDGGTPQWYRVQTGQKYYFSDITVEIMLAQEQVLLADYKGGFNESSTWLRYWVDGQDVIIGGDSHQAGMSVMMDTYDPEMLDFDIFFTLHHGSNTWQKFNDYCTYKTVIHPYFTIMGGANPALNEKAIAAGGEVLHEGGGTLVLTFPYKVGEYEKLEGKKWEYHNGVPKH